MTKVNYNSSFVTTGIVKIVSDSSMTFQVLAELQPRDFH